MVEGHSCHRVAHAHRRLLLNKRFKATSPNGRFAEGAVAIDGQPLSRIEVHGKNLFYFWGNAEAPVVMHIHFGMSGAFKTMTLPGPEPTETTRLQLVNERFGLMAHLSAMTVAHGDLGFYLEKAAKLGPDPLREDADGERLWARMHTSRKPVGLFLMDQTAIAGVGNIYRAEILFKAGVHPEQPGNTVMRAEFERIWRHSVLLLQRGFRTGSILTVDPDEAQKLGAPWTRRYIYNHKACGRCGGPIRAWDMSARTAYACESCQPLRLVEGMQLPAARAKALAAATDAKVFKSHCAPESRQDQLPSQLTVAELKAALKALNLSPAGKKAGLVMRLEQAQADTLSAGKAGPSAAAAGATASPSHTAAVAPASTPGVLAQPGLAASTSDVVGGPEPLAGEAHLEQLEIGEVESGQQAAPVDAGLAAQVQAPPSRLSVPQLKEQLRTFNMHVSGKKAELVHRLETALAAAAASGQTAAQTGQAAVAGQAAKVPASAEAAGRQARPAKRGTGRRGVKAGMLSSDAAARASAAAGEQPAEQTGRRRGGKRKAAVEAGSQAGSELLAGVQPGTAALDGLVSAKDAAAEKAAAGEGRYVEHIAEMDDSTAELLAQQRGHKPAAGRGRKRKAQAAGAGKQEGILTAGVQPGVEASNGIKAGQAAAATDASAEAGSNAQHAAEVDDSTARQLARQQQPKRPRRSRR